MKKSSKTAIGAMISALSVVMMLLTVIPVLTYTSPAMAGILLVLAVIELDKKWAMGVYAVVGVLSLIIATDKEAAVLYVLFFGYYPVLKAVYEGKLKPIISWILKFLTFNIAVVVAYFVLAKVFVIPMDWVEDFGKFTIPILFLGGNVVFFIYDRLITKLVIIYQMKWQKKFKKLFGESKSRR